MKHAWFSNDISDQELHLCGYQVVQLDCIKHGGGVAIYILNFISVKGLLSGPNSLEFLAVSLNIW